MKLFSLGRTALLALPFGFGLCIAGFCVSNANARTALQVIGVGVLVLGVLLGQQFVRGLQKSLDEA